MKNLTVLACVAAAACVGTATPVHAADNGLFLGAGISRTDFDAPGASDKTDTGYKAIAGLRLLDSFGVELNYADHGSARLPSGIACIALAGTNCPGTATLDAKTVSAFAVGFLDFPLVDLFAKAGVSRASSSLRVAGVGGFGGSEDDTNFAWGFGAQAHFLSFGVRAEFERFEVFGGRKLDAISASFVYTFL